MLAKRFARVGKTKMKEPRDGQSTGIDNSQAALEQTIVTQVRSQEGAADKQLHSRVALQGGDPQNNV